LQVVGIGISTGGPEALAKLLSDLPADLPVPVVVVQHMSATFTQALADRLSERTRLDVRHGNSDARLAPGQVWIAPGDFHVTVERGADGLVLRLNQLPAENSCRPSVDVLFRSLASTCGSRALGVVMTGMGQDGLLGSGTMRKAGGQIVVQDQASSVVWSMPGAVAKAGLADAMIPLSEMAAEIERRVRQSLRPAGKGR
jgi:two-component system chemotaxis response regulator CheB